MRLPCFLVRTLAKRMALQSKRITGLFMVETAGLEPVTSCV